MIAGCLVGALSACCLANAASPDVPLVTPVSIASTVAPAGDTVAVAKADGNILTFPVPKVGFRVGGGEWNDFNIDFGIDVTFNVPIIPVPALRVDGEVWGEPGNFGVNRRGNAFSILAIQGVVMGYFGAGPSYYFTDDYGDHHSGFGIKLLGGMSLPHSTFVEAGMILGPSSPPIFFSIGQRF